jgi:hypothetical protein
MQGRHTGGFDERFARPYQKGKGGGGMMTKQRLTQYNKLKREIASLEDRILAVESGGDLVTDYAKDYSTGNPKIITLRGYGSQEVPRLSIRLSKCAAECASIERFVDSIEDSILRQLLDLHFLEGQTMEEAAKKAGYSKRQAIRLINALFESRHPASPGVT